MNWRLLSLALLSALSVGCATLITGTSDNVQMTSRPVGARVTVQPGTLTLTTPATVELARRQGPYLLTFELEGYESQRAYISAESNPWVFGNILIGGVPGILVDWLTGAVVRLSPTEIEVELIPLSSNEEE